MRNGRDYEDEQLKARVVRRPNGEDDGVTLYPATEGVDDLRGDLPAVVNRTQGTDTSLPGVEKTLDRLGERIDPYMNPHESNED